MNQRLRQQVQAEKEQQRLDALRARARAKLVTKDDARERAAAEREVERGERSVSTRVVTIFRGTSEERARKEKFERDRRALYAEAYRKGRRRSVYQAGYKAGRASQRTYHPPPPRRVRAVRAVQSYGSGLNESTGILNFGYLGGVTPQRTSKRAKRSSSGSWVDDFF